jgi:hypothetical protein
MELQQEGNHSSFFFSIVMLSVLPHLLFPTFVPLPHRDVVLHNKTLVAVVVRIEKKRGKRAEMERRDRINMSPFSSAHLLHAY